MAKAVFFDLDGTLLDTAQDFAYSINLLLQDAKKPLVDFNLFRQEVYGESNRMISFAFNLPEKHPDFEMIRKNFLAIYHQNCTKKTVYFPGMELLIDSLDAKKIPWGIITNKPSWLTTPIVNHFELNKRAVCIISGDTLTKCKPDPLPLLHACEKARVSPAQAIYIGDSETDIIAAKNAGMKSIAVTYGYHPPHADFKSWNADMLAQSVDEISSWLL